MGFIDEKGRLFGKINIIDLLVVLVILGAILRVGYGRLSSKGIQSVALKQTTIEAVLLVQNVRQATVDVISVGDRVMETKSNLPLGVITDVTVTPAEVVVQMPDGRYYEAPSGSRKDIWITVRGPGRVSENSILLGPKEIRIGTPVSIKTNIYAVNTTVMKIVTGTGGKK